MGGLTALGVLNWPCRLLLLLATVCPLLLLLAPPEFGTSGTNPLLLLLATVELTNCPGADFSASRNVILQPGHG